MKKIVILVSLVLVLGLVVGCPQPNDSGNGGGETPVPPFMPMVDVPQGTYQYQGNTEKTVAAFSLATAEVTQGQWEAVMVDWPGKNEETSTDSGVYKEPLEILGKSANHPAYYVSWEDAIAFCNALSEKEDLSPYYNADGSIIDVSGTGYRLPTEAEWEYAAGHGGFEADGTTPKARFTYAGTNTVGTGEGQLGDYAWYSDNNGASGSKVVKKKTPNPLGLYDMSGNVWEWCYDIYVNDIRVFRSGSWGNSSSASKVTHRNSSYTYSFRGEQLGFRVARSY